MPPSESLRNLPAVDDVLRHDRIQPLHRTTPLPVLTQWVRDAVASCRRILQQGTPLSTEDVLNTILDGVMHRFQDDTGARLQPVLNATGILLHTNLGRAALADRAVERMRAVSAFANVELDLRTGKRSHRGARACSLLCRLTNAEDALIVNNCAAATVLALQAVATGREVIVSRSQLVEIGGGFRLPDVFATSGAVLKEVGTTNRTYLRDYEAAMTENTAAIIRVHRSNFYQAGFVTEPDVTDLVRLAHSHNVAMIDDVGSGCMVNPADFGLHEPWVQKSVRTGADLVLFSGDKLFGGPQAGVIVGSQCMVDQCRRHPLMRALRTDKLTLAAIEATAEIYLEGKASQEIPVWQMITRSAQQIRGTCDKIVQQLRSPQGTAVTVCECRSQIGGGSTPETSLDSYGLRITADSPDRMAATLRAQTPAVMGRIEDGAVVLDLRTIPEPAVPVLTDAIQSALNAWAQ